ncbi:hypothetical protein [Pseudomonas aeruginosa]|uniref:hypothetical protein n=1 Tax=Pseudomonas aeruginosa TaxID=287 RepID=UPI002E2B4D45|nr:hypothetical protein [Pseudomonas aeruginosa]
MTSPALDSFILGFAAIVTEEPPYPDTFRISIGVTTLQDVEHELKIIDQLGVSYTGGPVLALCDWELKVQGLRDLQLTFNSQGTVDVVLAKIERAYYPAIKDAFNRYLPLECEIENDHGFCSTRFAHEEMDVALEVDSMSDLVSVTCTSASFRQAISDAQQRYA